MLPFKSGKSSSTKAEVTGGIFWRRPAKYKMVVKRDVEKRGGIKQTAREREIGIRGRRIAGRMVMGADETRGVETERVVEDVAGMESGGVDGAARDFNGRADEAVFGVEGKEPENFLMRVFGKGF